MGNEHYEPFGIPYEVKRKQSEVLVCGHCANKAPMEVLHQHSDLEMLVDGTQVFVPPEGDVFEWLRCHSCREMTLRRFQWSVGYDMRLDEIQPVTMYPLSTGRCGNLPPHIMSGYRAAEKVKTIDANAYGVLAGRVLDLICLDKSASGDTLNERIKSLSDNNQIPPTLTDVAHGLRSLRNVGAHADLGELSSKEIPILEGLLTALIEYLYTAPSLVAEAQARLDAVKRKK